MDRVSTAGAKLDPNRSVTASPQKCPGCYSTGRLEYLGVHDAWCLEQKLYDLARCEACDSLYISPSPTTQEVREAYGDNYYTHRQSENVIEQSNKQKLSQRLRQEIFKAAYGYDQSHPASAVLRAAARLRCLRRRSGHAMRFLDWKPGGRLLEVGCGDGSFMKEALTWGWQCTGIEPDPQAACHKLEVKGIQILAGDLSLVHGFPYHFDRIVLHHVIEHLPAVQSAVAILATALRPQGQLISISPNPNGIGLAVSGKWWPGLDPPRHTFIPSGKFLTDCCQKSGLESATFSLHRNLGNYAVQANHNKRHGKPNSPADIRAKLCRILAPILDLALAPLGDELVLMARKL